MCINDSLCPFTPVPSPQDCRSFNFRRRDADAIARLQHIIGSGRLAVDADQVIRGAAVRDTLLKQLSNGGAFGDIDLVGEPGAEVVQKENLHQ